MSGGKKIRNCGARKRFYIIMHWSKTCGINGRINTLSLSYKFLCSLSHFYTFLVCDQKSTDICPSDERIQILQEPCKIIQNMQDSCKNLARYQSRQKKKSGYKCFRKHLWSKLLFIKQITKPNSMKKKNSSVSKTCKNLASFWILENLFVYNWWLKLTETQMKWLISVFFDQQNWT